MISSSHAEVHTCPQIDVNTDAHTLLAVPAAAHVLHTPGRFRDNRHNVSDVVGGLLLGATFAPFFMARLVWHYQGWLEVEQQQLSGVQLQLQASNSALPVALPPVSDGHRSGYVDMVNMRQ